MKLFFLVFAASALIMFTGCRRVDADQNDSDASPQEKGISMNYQVEKSDQEWREDLTRDQYRVLRQGETERAFTGKYYKFFEEGEYLCGACGAELFDAGDKYDSHCGWPAFTQPKERDNIEERVDTSHEMVRTEIKCAKCGSHLGHVFADGPEPTGMRYCVNSAALQFKAMIGSEKDK